MLEEEKYIKISSFLKDFFNIKSVEIGIILGSGLNEIKLNENELNVIDYAQIPDFPKTTVLGHKGKLSLYQIERINILIFKGRFHYYEGYSMEEVILPIRIFKYLGGKVIIITNAAGSIHRDWSPGEFMIIKDHINLMGLNPLRGKNLDNIGPRFPDMSSAYDKDLILLAKENLTKLNIPFHEGVYAAMSGPSYETPAEINMLKIIGADAVGMSTVPEVIAAVHAGIKVFAISFLSNFASGVTNQVLEHDEVISLANKVKEHLEKFLINFIDSIIKKKYLNKK